MKKDAGEQQADPRALRRPFHRLGVHAVLQNADSQLLACEPQDARVSDPVLDHSHQPLVVYRVVELANVGQLRALPIPVG
jgi:hypothetical protein